MIGLEPLLSADDYALFHAACLNRPPRSVHVRDDRTSRPLPFDTLPLPWFKTGAWLLDGSIRPASFLHYPAADYYIQDAGSLLPVALMLPQPGETVCDLCAAPGGKSTAILELMSGNGVLLVNENIRSRVDALKTMLGRTGLCNYLVSQYDPEDLSLPLLEAFDAVLVDAPCSGQMLVGKDKRSENAWSETQVVHSAKRQCRILDSAIHLVRPGGRLIYSTCTFAIEENEKQIQRIMDLHPGAWEPLERASLEPWRSPIQPGCYRLWPHRDRCAGGFAGGLVRTDAPLSCDKPEAPKKRSSASRKALRGHPKEEHRAVEHLAELGDVSDLCQWRLWNDMLCMGHSDAWKLVDHCWLPLEPIAGLYKKVERWLPNHSLALQRSDYFRPNRIVDLEEDSAIRYLAGEALSGESLETKRSAWCVAAWQGMPLGWMKETERRFNNHLPAWANWRM